MIIYCRNLGMCAKIYEFILEAAGACALLNKPCISRKENWNVALVEMYHASNSPATQEHVLSEFCKTESTIRCLIATVAFGMGVQVPDVRLMIHWGLPTEPLNYWQEIGRAGRDGKKSLAVTLAYPRSKCHKSITDNMKSLVKVKTCTRAAILEEMACKGMDTSPLTHIGKGQPCQGKQCKDICECPCCLCCSSCSQKCQCQSKCNTVCDLVKHMI